MFSTGGRIPTATRLPYRVSDAKAITISPTVLKKTPVYELERIPNGPKLKSASTGSVPKAKAVIVMAPAKKLPDDNVYTCID